MSQIAAPYGFRPIGVLGQEYNTNGFSDYPLITDNPIAISVGDPVALINGSIAPSAVAATTTLSVNTPIGIVWGFSYVDAMGKIWETPYLPALAISALGFTSINVKVVDDPRATMYIQNFATPLPAIVIGMNATYKNFGTSGTKNCSTIALDQASIATTATLALRIVRVDNPGDPFPDIVVAWNAGVHAYAQAQAH